MVVHRTDWHPPVGELVAVFEGQIAQQLNADSCGRGGRCCGLTRVDERDVGSEGNIPLHCASIIWCIP